MNADGISTQKLTCCRASASAEDPEAVAAEIEAQAQSNTLGLVTGAAKRGAVTQSRTLQDFWGAPKPKKAKAEPAPAMKPEAPPRPPATAEAQPVKAEPSAAVKKKEVIEID